MNYIRYIWTNIKFNFNLAEYERKFFFGIRTLVPPDDPDSLNARIQDGGWNECHLVVRGNRMQHYINNVLMSDVTDNDTINRSFSGLIGVQVHVGPPMKVEYRNIRLKEFNND